jgi:hypothetical protein
VNFADQWLQFGMPLLFLMGAILGPILISLVFLVPGVLLVRRRATRHGYDSVAAYLRAAPRTDAEKRDAVDLALKGLACCLLGLLFPPAVMLGIVPLFYGGRKVVYASMGLGLVDDVDPPRA